MELLSAGGVQLCLAACKDADNQQLCMLRIIQHATPRCCTGLLDCVFCIVLSVLLILPYFLVHSDSRLTIKVTCRETGCVQEAFAKYVDVNSVAESLAAPKAARLTPKAFMHSITQKCRANPQHIVLPEVLCSSRLLHLGVAKATN